MNLILLVESNVQDRRRIGSWLEDAGYALMDCPGPKREDFSCLGIRGQHCGLVEVADLIILDGQVLQGAGADAKGGTRLLHYYLRSGKPVLVLLDPKGRPVSFESDRAATADRTNAQAVLRAVSELLSSVELAG